MKKLYLIFIALSLTVLFLGCGNKNEQQHRYSSMASKDTIASFGDDGRFGIFHVSIEPNVKKKDLSDLETGKVIDYITKYKEIEPYVYTVGENGYTKLNYTTGELIQSDNLDKFSDEDKEVFNNLK